MKGGAISPTWRSAPSFSGATFHLPRCLQTFSFPNLPRSPAGMNPGPERGSWPLECCHQQVAPRNPLKAGMAQCQHYHLFQVLTVFPGLEAFHLRRHGQNLLLGWIRGWRFLPVCHAVFGNTPNRILVSMQPVPLCVRLPDITPHWYPTQSYSSTRN